MKLGLERNEQAVGVLLACSGARRVKEKPLFLKLNKGEATSSWIFLIQLVPGFGGTTS